MLLNYSCDILDQNALQIQLLEREKKRKEKCKEERERRAWSEKYICNSMRKIRASTVFLFYFFVSWKMPTNYCEKFVFTDTLRRGVWLRRSWVMVKKERTRHGKRNSVCARDSHPFLCIKFYCHHQTLPTTELNQSNSVTIQLCSVLQALKVEPEFLILYERERTVFFLLTYAMSCHPRRKIHAVLQPI